MCVKILFSYFSTKTYMLWIVHSSEGSGKPAQLWSTKISYTGSYKQQSSDTELNSDLWPFKSCTIYLPYFRGVEMVKFSTCPGTMYLSKENFTCPIVQISLYLSVLKQFTLSKTVWNHVDINSIVNSVDPDQLASDEASWSGSTLFLMQHVNS